MAHLLVNFPLFHSPSRSMRIELLCIAASALVATFSQAVASVITVDDAGSGSVVGKCTIQDAVLAANTNAAVHGCAAGSLGADTIQFAAGITTITLTAPMTSANNACVFALAVSEDLAIDASPVAGSGVPKVTIQRSVAAGTPSFGIIGASNSNCGGAPQQLNLVLSGLTIRNGTVAGLFDANGGGVAADVVTIHDSVLADNIAANGGGVYAFTSLVMSTSTVSGNTASGNCGGICGQTMSIYGSTINGNTARSDGGGIGGGPITLINSTVSGNNAETGSGIDANGLVAQFATITANTGASVRSGAGVYLEQNFSSVPIEFDDTVIAGNTGAGDDLDTSNALPISGSHNWIDTMNTVARNDLDNGVVLAACPTLNLSALANNGGGTQTHALSAGSCLIDAGGSTSPVTGQLIPNDQRGKGFARFVNTNADIGAFEYQGVPTGVSGACGADSGAVLLTAPTRLCSIGTASSVVGSGHPWTWSCSGSAGGTSASCSATIKTWTVNVPPVSGGTVSPATQSIDNGAAASFTITPNAGFQLERVSGCGGALDGATYTTAAVTADCAIAAAFSQISSPVPTVDPVAAPTLSTIAMSILFALMALAATATLSWPTRDDA